MDVKNFDKIGKRMRPRSQTVAFAREITRNEEYNKKGNEERRPKSASSVGTDDRHEYNEECRLYFTRTQTRLLRFSVRDYPFGSLKIIKKQRRDSGLRSLDDIGQDYEMDHQRKRSTISNESTDLSLYSNDDDIDVNWRDEESDHGSFTSEDMMHLENSIRMSQLRAEKKVLFYPEEVLHDAIQRDDLDELCDLLPKHRELDLEQPNSFGITPLHRAAIDGGYRCLNFLLSRDVNVKVRDLYGWTPLHDAVYHGHIRCAAALITAGANVEAETNDFIKPIEMASNDEMLLLVGRAMTTPGYAIYDQDRETLV